ncbi:MAG: hypothetical protein ACP5I8_05245 [Phycisphaerae bacterium]
MAATSPRQEALERISKVFHEALERIIPADDNQRLKEETFRDFELQAQEFKAALIPTLLEERARLTDSAEVLEVGCYPHCGPHPAASGPAFAVSVFSPAGVQPLIWCGNSWAAGYFRACNGDARCEK